MKCQSLVSRKNKINITSLSSAESAHSVISINAYLLCPVDVSNLEVSFGTFCMSNTLSEQSRHCLPLIWKFYKHVNR